MLCSAVAGNYEKASEESGAFVSSSSTLEPVLMTLLSADYDLMDYSLRVSLFYLSAENQLTRRTFPAQQTNTSFSKLLDPADNNFLQTMKQAYLH